MNCNMVDQRLHNDPLIQQIFNQHEIALLEKIAEYYDSVMIHKTNINDIDSAYHQYNEILLDPKSPFDFRDVICMDRDLIKSFINSIVNHQGFQSIWEQVVFKSEKDTNDYFLRFNCEGSYMEFLNKMSLKDSAYYSYYYTIEGWGGEIPPTIVMGYTYYHKRRDFSDAKERLVAAIHYITLGTRLGVKK